MNLIKKRWLWAILGVLVVGLFVAAAPATRVRDLGSPVLFVLDEKGEPKFILPTNMIFQLRSDGLIGWKPIPEMKGAKKAGDGLVSPDPDYNAGRR